MHSATTIIVPDCPSAGFVSCVNKRHLLVNYLHDVKDILQLYELSTGQLVRDLPLKVGTVCGVSCKKKHSEFFYKFTSFTTPGRWCMTISDRFSMSGMKLFFFFTLKDCFFSAGSRGHSSDYGVSIQDHTFSLNDV